MKIPSGRRVIFSVHSSTTDSKTDQMGAYQQEAEPTKGMGYRHHGHCAGMSRMQSSCLLQHG